MSRLDEIKARYGWCERCANHDPWDRRDHGHLRSQTEIDALWLVDQVESLERWKFEALEVMSGLRELGKALGLGLGVQITGPAALAEVARLTAERDALIAVGKRQAARLARVEALAEWFDSVQAEHLSQDDCQCEMKDCYECGPWHACIHNGPPGRARQIRDALADSEADTYA